MNNVFKHRYKFITVKILYEMIEFHNVSWMFLFPVVIEQPKHLEIQLIKQTNQKIIGNS